MRILLIGEFSGVHNNLKKGLESLGYSVVLANDGDSYKMFSQQVKLHPFKSRIFGKILNIMYFLLNIRKFTGYDIVQFISPFSLSYYYFYFCILHIVMRFNKKVVYYVCGTEPALFNAIDKLRYFPYDAEDSKELKSFNKRSKKRIYNYFIKNVDLIIPSSYSYAIGYKENPKLQQTILLPGSGDVKINLKPVSDKIKILFGITRPEVKGAKYITEALNNISKVFPDEVEITIIERLPFNEYIEHLEGCDILIDQCKSYGYAMNAIFALEKGVIVLSGAEKEEMEDAGIEECPIINIIPDHQQIQKEIIRLINLSDKEITLLKEKSAVHSRNYHNPVNIAKDFCKSYQNLLTS